MLHLPVLVGCGMLAGALLFFGAWRTGAFFASATVLCVPGRSWITLAKLPLTLGGLGIAGLCWHVPFHEYQDQVDGMTARLDRGPEAMTVWDLSRIWLLNAGMAGAGWGLGMREVAAETFWLGFPGPAERVWFSDFAMMDPVVRRALKGWDGREKTVAWRYDWPRESVPVALALNSPLTITGVRGASGLTVEARAPMRYPPRYALQITRVRGRGIHIQEGLFWAAQERGWMHPYTAVWIWKVDDDDLEDPTTVHRRLLEGLVLP